LSPGPELAGGQASPDSHLQLAPRKPRGETAFVQSAALHIPADGRLTRWVFLRGLGLVWLAAFLSLWSQIMGLLGTEGVARAAQRLGDIGHFWETGAEGFPWWRLPTLSWWWGAGDGALDWMCGAGTALSVLLIAGVAPAAMLAGLFALYLSLVHLSAGFLAYQWDALLLEVTFVAMFHAPLCLVDRLASPTPPARWTTLLLRLVLFKVMFMSGGAKLASGDAVWRDLTALDYDFWTQPLPHGARLPLLDPAAAPRAVVVHRPVAGLGAAGRLRGDAGHRAGAALRAPAVQPPRAAGRGAGDRGADAGHRADGQLRLLQPDVSRQPTRAETTARSDLLGHPRRPTAALPTATSPEPASQRPAWADRGLRPASSRATRPIQSARAPSRREATSSGAGGGGRGRSRRLLWVTVRSRRHVHLGYKETIDSAALFWQVAKR